MEVKIDADELCELRREASRADRLRSDLLEISSKHNRLVASLDGGEPWFMDMADHSKYVARSHKQICRLNDVITELRKENDKQQCTIDGLRLKIANATWELQ